MTCWRTSRRCSPSWNPNVFDAADAALLVERFTRGERLCAAGKGLAARRVEECGTWKREGFRSGAHWLAGQSGVTIGAAEQALRTARALDELPATEAAFRAGALSEVQAAEISGAALGDPSSETALLEAAAWSSVKALRRECRQVRAAFGRRRRGMGCAPTCGAAARSMDR